ncbi:MAG TPA: hypothetical protein PK796_05145 [Bacteroidales bacterium]|nr:hypothetical protein [Bacteroidales bacterium]
MLNCLFKFDVYLQWLLLPLMFLPVKMQAQYYNLGQDPASVSWRQINTEHFKLIYPGEFERKAQQLANVLEFTYPLEKHTMGKPPKMMPILLHTSNVDPNALTAWAPRRIEMFTCPPQNSYAQDWLQQLAVHEYRHAIQIGMMNQGFTKGLSYILGEQAHAISFGLFVPDWFLEGDAVCTETLLSNSGRGRVPSFEQGLRTQILSRGSYSYDKAVFGSYKDYVPNEYEIGYQIVANTRRLYGAHAWEMVMSNVACKPYTLRPFDRALQSLTGLDKVGIYERTITDLDSIWKVQQSKLKLSPKAPVPVKAVKSFAQFKYPQYVSDSLFVAEKTSLDDISRFVLFDRKGNEKILVTPGFFSADVFSFSSGSTGNSLNKPGSFTADNISVSEGLMAWSEREIDPRWEQRSYSVIKLYDFNSAKTSRITSRSRLFAPAISPDASVIAAVRITRINTSSVVLLDRATGDIMKVLCSSPDELYMTPTWSPDGKQLVVTVLNNRGKSLRLLNVANTNAITIAGPTFTEISNPVFAGHYVLFTGSFSGIENIYAADTSTRNLYMVTSSAFGACNPSYNAGLGKIVYSDYTSQGYRPVEAVFDAATWIPADSLVDNSSSLFKWLLSQETGIVDSIAYGNTNYNSQPYSKAAHLFRFHSWAPAFFDFNSSYIKPGISIVSQNELSTATTLAGYDWDAFEKTGRFKLNFEYAGWYPVLNAGVTSGKRSSTETNTEGKTVKYTWRETTLTGGIKVPLHFLHGTYYCGLQPSINTTWSNISDNTSSDTSKLTGTVNTLDYRLYAYNLMKQSSKDIYPRWGQTLDLNLRHSPFGSNRLGNIQSAETNLFFPGIMQHHGLRLYAGLQRRIKGDYTYSNIVNLPRGYSAMIYNRMYSAGLTYKFPFLYPDYPAGRFAYFQRVKAALFYDLTFAGDAGVYDRFESYGAELTTDMHLLRFIFPFDTGIRIGYMPQNDSFFVDFLFSVNFAF